MLYDLHIHTTASDGIMSAQQIIDCAVKQGLPGISITDHDTASGINIAVEYIKERNLCLEFIPGIELNTEIDGEEIHILGYFIDPSDRFFNNKLEEIRTARLNRVKKIIDKLNGLGYTLELQEVKNKVQGELMGRPHIARAMMEKGYVASITEAFDKYIGMGKPAYVSHYKFSPQEAIDLIKQAGGVSILAHPGLIKEQSKIEEIIAWGIEGMEVFYPEHTYQHMIKYQEKCIRQNLLITGGSDFHGIGRGERKNRLGCSGVNQELFSKLMEYNNKKR